MEMRARGLRSFTKMGVRLSLFKLLLFQIMVLNCAAKTIPENSPRIEIVSDVEDSVQNSIRNLIHTGESLL